MDRLDVAIFRELLQGDATTLSPDFRRSSRAIAKRLRLNEDTVRKRVRRFEETGLIREWHLIVNPHCLDTEDVGLWFDVPPTIAVEELIARLKLIDGVYLIVPTYTSRVGLIMRVRSAAMGRHVELLERLCGVHAEGGKILWPPCTSSFSRTDARIIRALLTNPRKPVALVSKEAGVSDRTAGRRIRRMIRAGSMASLARIDQRAARDILFADLYVSCPAELEEEIEAKIAAQYPEGIWFVLRIVPVSGGATHHSVFNFILHNISEAEEISAWVGALRGVSAAGVYIVKSWIFVFESLDESLEERFASLLRGGGAAARELATGRRVPRRTPGIPADLARTR